MRETDTAGIVFINGEAFAPNHPKAKEFLSRNSPSKLHSEKPQSVERSKGEDRGLEAPAPSICYRVTFIVRRPRLLDDGDNDRFALKCGRDFITSMVGLTSDKGPGISFDYHQIQSRSKSTTVIIEYES